MTTPSGRNAVILAVVLLVLSAGELGAADFNNQYSAPFGFRTDARVENAVKFGYFTEQGTVKGVNKGTHGGIFDLQLAFEDSFGFALQTIWRNSVEEVTLSRCSGSVAECQEVVENYGNNSVTIGLTPKYRFLNLDWVWGSAAIQAYFPIATKPDELRVYEVDPGVQFYFNTGDWFAVEVDASFLMNISDPEEAELIPGTTVIPEDDEEFIGGVYARVNFLLKILGQHFIGLQVEDTAWFRDLSAAREQNVLNILSYRAGAEADTNSEKLDMAYFANHQLNVGGGYRVNLGVFEGGVGGFMALTQRERRQNWGVNADVAFTF